MKESRTRTGRLIAAVVAATGLLAALLLAAPGTLLWQHNLNGTATGIDARATEVAEAVAVTPQGDVVAAGSTSNTGTGPDFTVAKFDRNTGTLLWQHNLNGNPNVPNVNEEAHAVAVTPEGDVVAAGFTANTASTSIDFTVAKFDRNTGTLLWQHNLNGTANGSDEADAVAVTPQGDVVAAGSTDNTGTGRDFTVAKFDRNTGTLLWQHNLNGTAAPSLIIGEKANAVAVTPEGDVVAAGFTFNGTGFDFTVAKFDRNTGSLLWQHNLNDARANAVAVTPEGDVVAAGFTSNTDTGIDFTVAKFDRNTGTLLWQHTLTGNTAPGIIATDEARAVAVTPEGDVVAAGFTANTGTGFDFTVAKFDRNTGTLLWQHNLNGTANGSDEAEAVAVTPQGDVVAAGFTRNPADFDFTVAKFNRNTGTLLWQQNLNGTANPSFDDAARAVAVTPNGDVVAAGLTLNTGTFTDFTVAKFLDQDTSPPIITPNILGTLGLNGWYRSSVNVTWNVSDPESGIASSSGCGATTLTADTAGVTLTCSATNGVGLSTSVPVTIKIDKTAPVISGLPAQGCTIWPPNGKLVGVATISASDALSGMASFSVTGTSNEPSDPKDPSIVITGSGLQPRTVQLLARRLGTGSGRIYTITATATDLAGNSGTASATCTVPHDQGK